MSEIRVAHVLVGAGLIGYMHNALNSAVSALESRPGDKILAIYNATSEWDRNNFVKNIATKDWPKFVETMVQSNGKTRKTGSLYSSYNLALERLNDQFDLVNFIQADMQMIAFPDAIASFAFKRIGEFSEGVRVLCISNQFPVFGREFGSFEKRMVLADSGFWVSRGNSISDSALFNPRLLKELKFRFEGSESDLSKKWADAGFRFGLAMPFMAAIPFPSAVRPGNKIVGISGRTVLSRQILNIRQSPPTASLNHPGWLEQVALPSRGRIPYPYWVTDFRNPEWLARRKEATSNLGLSIFASVDNSGKISIGFSPEIAAQLGVLLFDGIRYRVVRRLGLDKLRRSIYRLLDFSRQYLLKIFFSSRR